MSSFFLGMLKQVYLLALFVPRKIYLFCKYLYRRYFVYYALFRFLRHAPRNAYLFCKYLYQRYLVYYAFFRFLRHAPRNIRTYAQRVRASLAHRLGSKRYQAVKRSAYIEKKGVEAIAFNAGGVLEIPGPSFVGEYNFTPIGARRVELVQPSISIALYHDATVMGGTNYTIIDKTIIQPDVCDMGRDVCPAELNGIAKVEVGARQISLYVGKVREVEEAISLLGCCTGNYAHWLTETLPKLLYVDSVAKFDGYPLLVDAWIHPNFIASIDLIKKQNRQLIRVPRWSTVKVAKLVDISPPAYVPPEHRVFHENNLLADPVANDFPMSRAAFNLLKARVYQVMQLNAPEKGLKLFLRRTREHTGNTRYLRNTDEVERLVKAYGYTFLDPASLSFTEQVSLFSKVTHIISPLGAALSNLMFTPEGCQVVGLSPYYDRANYYYFSNLMGVLGHDLHYVLGEQVLHDTAHPLHRDYIVDIQALKMALDMVDGSGGVN